MKVFKIQIVFEAENLAQAETFMSALWYNDGALADSLDINLLDGAVEEIED